MKAFARTDRGMMRQSNQDALYASTGPVGKLPNLFMVADGMGGHLAGDYASSYLIGHMVEEIRESGDREGGRIIRDTIDSVNREIFRLSCEKAEYSGMGTTLVAAWVADDTLYAANIGDSRLYLSRKGQAVQITKDHAYVEEMVERGRMRRGSAEYARSKNIITRAVGIDSQVSADFFEADLMPGDRFLLCSDGLSNMVDDDEIAGIAGGAGELSDLTEKLVYVANRHGGRDNISVILADPEISEVMRHDA